MRFLLVFICFFGVNLLGKNIEEGLKYLEIPNSKRQILKEAIRELYKQRQNYHSNDVILEYNLQFFANDEGGEKTEEPTAKKIEGFYKNFLADEENAIYRNRPALFLPYSEFQKADSDPLADNR